MSQDNIKLHKNPNRKLTVEHKPYVPQYQILGVEPGEFRSATVPSNTPISKGNSDNPRAKKIGLRQPYAVAVDSPIKGTDTLPNVGNNVEQTWSSVDSEIVDDLQDIDVNQAIDNNEYVTDTALGNGGPIKIAKVSDKIKLNDSDDLLSIVHDLEENSYLLIVSGVAMCSGPVLEIEEQARALVFGEHEYCDGSPIPVEDIVILKRVPIKMGLFLT